MIGDGLAYVAVAVRNVTEVARTLERDFQMARWDCAVGDSQITAPVFPVGQTALALFELGDPFVGGAEKTGVHHLAVSVDDPAKASVQAAENGVPSHLGSIQAGLGGASRLLLDPAATGGVITYLSEPLKLPASATSSASGTVQRIDHIGVASSDNQLAMEVFSRRLGWPVESTQTDAEMTTTVETFTSDKYGVTHHTRQSRIAGALRVAFITIGDCEIEFLQELNQESKEESSQRPASSQIQKEQAGSTQQDQSVISRYIDSRGPGLHHIALKVSDIDGLLANLAKAGHSLIDNAGRPGSRRAQIGFIHPASLGGLLVHLVQREEI
ncbi:MAG TPA: hypothetical protein EYM65_04755 [Dehalococcoidia bacterium]|nr:hypothetical protein [Dehalococcoidia bacterium]